MFHFAWCDYYNKTLTYETKNEDETFNSESSTLQPNSGDAYIYNCFFSDMKATDGGAILYSKAFSYLLIEKCSFLRCNVSHYSAAIRVTAGNGICVRSIWLFK